MQSTRDKTSSESSKNTDYLLNNAMALRCLIGLNLSWIGPLIPTIASAQGASLSEAGFLVSSYYVGAIPVLTTGRWFLNKLGVKLSLLVASLFMCLGLFTIAVGKGMPFLWVGSLIFGAGSGLTVIAGSVFALVCGRDNPASLLNKLAMFYGVGALSGPIIAWLGCLTAWNYHLVYLFGALYALVVGVLLKLDKKSLPVDKQIEPKEGLRGAHKSIDVWACAFLLLIYIGVEIGTTAWLFTYFTRALSISDGLSALGVSLLCAGLTLGRLISISLCRRFSVNLITVSAMLLSTLGLGLLAVHTAMGVEALLLAFVIGIGFGPIYPNILATISNKYPQEVGTVTPIVISVSFAGGVFMPFVIALVFEQFGLSEGVSVIALTSFLTLVLYLAFRYLFLIKK